MTTEADHAFIAALRSDAALQGELRAWLADPRHDGAVGTGLVSFARAKGFAFDERDLDTFRLALGERPEGELDEETLDSISGGGLPDWLHDLRYAL